MPMLFVTLFFLSFGQADSVPLGRPDIVTAAWVGRSSVAFCTNCHGAAGQGGFGPDLAGRGLTFAQFRRAVHKPWGAMPAFPQLTDQTIADMQAYLATLPKVAEAGNPRPLPPPGSPAIQRYFIASGCGQCHGLEASDPRRDLGGWAKDVTFETFAKVVYDGVRPIYAAAQTPTPNRMGLWSRDRIPESALREIYHWLTEETGLRVPLTAEIGKGVESGSDVTYTLVLDNEGLPGKGLTAEDITISLAVPEGAKVVKATGAGYQGVRMDPQAKAQMATWNVSRIGPAEKQTYSLTLSGVAVAKDLFKASTIRWSKPALRRPAGQVARDARIPEQGDWIAPGGQAQRANGEILPMFGIPPDR